MILSGFFAGSMSYRTGGVADWVVYLLAAVLLLELALALASRRP